MWLQSFLRPSSKFFLFKQFMWIEGIKLMIMGMTTVFLFLVVMMFCIHLIAWVSRHATKVEQKQIEKENRGKADLSPLLEEESVPIAVFAAAITAYEAER